MRGPNCAMRGELLEWALDSARPSVGIAILISNDLNILHGININIDTNASMERQLLVVHLIAVHL